MTNEYLLGIDIGTYSSKGVLVKLNGEVAASAVIPHEMDMPRPGYFEQDAEKVWWQDLVKIVRSLYSRTEISSSQIIGIGLSGIGACVLPIDQNGKPLRPAILYGIDARAEEEAMFLKKTLGTEENISAQSSVPKILWIRNHEKSIFDKARWFLTSQSYLVFKLTGFASIDIYSAGDYAPFFDVRRFCWDQEALKNIIAVDCLPKPLWTCEIAGAVTSEAARETGLSEGTPVIAGTTDAAAEAISAGVAKIGDMMIMFGSTVFFLMKSAELIRTRYFWNTNFLEEGTFAFAGGTSTAGSLITWFRNQFAQPELELEKQGGENAFSALAKMAVESPVGANGLIVLPYFEGERTPLHDRRAKGLAFGLSLKHSRADIYRAILEGVGFSIRHNLEIMRQEGVSPSVFRAVGGGSKNAAWMQIVADIANIKLSIPQQQIGASFGDAFLAGMGIGVFRQLNEVTRWVKDDWAALPNMEAHDKYALNYRIFRSLYDATKLFMHELSESQFESHLANADALRRHDNA